jgi:type II secretory pathway pseudopilin PulG
MEVTVVVGIIALLIGILIPTAQAVRHQSYVTQCASHLQQLGVAVRMYVTENRSLPRTTFAPDMQMTRGTGTKSLDPFSPSGPVPNDVTAGIHLLRRAQNLEAGLFICPFSDADLAIADTAVAKRQSNFTDYRQNLGYSFANPYPRSNATIRMTRLLGKSFVLAGDINPGFAGIGDNVALPTLDSRGARLRMANSVNHDKEGQNVLFGDGRVEWTHTAFVGPLEDNIYTNRRGETWAGPVDDLDAMLLPTDD